MGLIAMREEAPRQSGADDQGNDRVSGHAGSRIGVGGRGERKVDAQECLKAPISLALNIDDGDNRPLRIGGIGSDGFPNVMGECPSLLEPELTVLGSRKAISLIRHNREQPHPLASPGCVGDEHAPETGVNGLCFVGQCLEPGPAAARWPCVCAHCMSPFGHIWRSAGPSGGAAGSMFAKLRLYSSTFSLR